MAEEKKRKSMYSEESHEKMRDKHDEPGHKPKTDAAPRDKEGKPPAKKMSEKRDGAGDEPEKERPGHEEMHERHHEAREAMHKAHETERRDMHGNHREEHRKMHERHQKQHKELADAQMAEMQAAGANPATAGQPSGPGSEGAAPAAPESAAAA